MTKPKPRTVGSTIDVPDGALVIPPNRSEAEARAVSGGVYVFDRPGEHIVDGKAYEVVGDDEPEAQPTP